MCTVQGFDIPNIHKWNYLSVFYITLKDKAGYVLQGFDPFLGQ
jgi:hypothetical protein